MEQLELKHILPYLPYELIVKDFGVLFSLSKSNNDAMFDYAADDDIEVTKGYIEGLVPLLRPMSDLFESIVHNGEIICVAKLICEQVPEPYKAFRDWEIMDYQGVEVIYDTAQHDFLSFESPELLENWITEILNEYHFDWRYDLLLKGLAEPIINNN